ncbi:hypothetical protein LCL96_13525 [Rossellomorea aquimaris]|uniref:hypothetical protein n=1 Tax=Rossellomorea aquimaris TaxID=189382 RepID=UPI001CD7D82F|nr:hypothetical protein [Rossellomorea aquimaris]MCA1059952.1 hypothetical protein [Rossellomorea aquimaris]
MTKKNFPFANLSEDTLVKVRNMENELRQETNVDIVLIAYKNTKQHLEGGR